MERLIEIQREDESAQFLLNRPKAYKALDLEMAIPP
jgi:hypothetical protein